MVPDRRTYHQAAVSHISYYPSKGKIKTVLKTINIWPSSCSVIYLRCKRLHFQYIPYELSLTHLKYTLEYDIVLFSNYFNTGYPEEGSSVHLVLNERPQEQTWRLQMDVSSNKRCDSLHLNYLFWFLSRCTLIERSIWLCSFKRCPLVHAVLNKKKQTIFRY